MYQTLQNKKCFHNIILVSTFIIFNLFISLGISQDTKPEEVEFLEDTNVSIVGEKYHNCFSNETAGECMPFSLCRLSASNPFNMIECELGPDTQGVCCPKKEEEEEHVESRSKSRKTKTFMKVIQTRYKNINPIGLEKRSKPIGIEQKTMLKRVTEDALKLIEDEEERLSRILEESVRFHKVPSEKLQDIETESKMAEMDLLVTQGVAKVYKMKRGAGGTGKVEEISLTGLEFRSAYRGKGDCSHEVIECDPKSKRRSFNGSCNNLENPSWGTSGSTYQRLLDPVYEDGFDGLRVQKDWEPLPSARVISSLYSEDQSQELEDTEHTLAFVQFGQFLDHDLTSTPLAGTDSVQCCTRHGRVQAKENAHKNCIAIEVHRNDPFYKPFGQRCIHMVRSAPGIRPDCRLGPREQINLATSFIDGSQIYGTSIRSSRRLRLLKGGRLRMASTEIERRVNNSEGFLPPEDTTCESAPPKCIFDAGDNRVNENMQLAVIHTVFLREHNRLAKALEVLNPHWGDATLFHEARRIVIAQLQHITYNEFLPIVLGSGYMEYHKLFPQSTGGYTNLYDEEMDGTTLNVFAAAAFRFGHTLVPSDVSLADKEGKLTHYINLRRSFFNPAGLFRHFDRFLLGMTKQISRRYDQFLIPDLTQLLFENANGFGLDLMAINIQRGRDHGLPAYEEWHKLCGGELLDTWDTLKKYMKPEAVDVLSNVYTEPGEIDLYVGGIAEFPEGDALLGKTFVCIIGNQFIRLRRGDRFFYEEKSGGFTKAQLNELRQISLARILCDNSKGIKKMQPLVMREFRKTNKEISCKSENIPTLDLNHWKAKQNAESKKKLSRN